MVKHLSIWAAVLTVAAALGYYIVDSRGSDQPAFVGMQIQGLNPDMAEALGRTGPAGVLIRDIALGGPADEAGFRRGDLIVKFDGQPIDGFETMLQLVGAARADARIPVTVVRRGEETAITLRSGRWTEAWKAERASSLAIPQIGLTLSSLTSDVRARFNLPWGSLGLVVSAIDPEIASVLDLRAGEIVAQVNQQTVWTPEQVQSEVAQAKQMGRKTLLVLVQGVGGFRFSLVPVQ